MKNTKINAVITSNPLARKFFEKLSQRSNNARATTVKSVLVWASKEVPANKREVVALFKTVEGWEKARFIEGRRGKPSRLVWTVNALEFAKEVLANVDGEVHESPITETSGKTALDAIQAFFADEGIESRIAPGPGGKQYLVANNPFGPLWTQLSARCEKEGAKMFVSLPIFSLLVRESIETELDRVNKGLRYGRFFVNERDTKVIYAVEGPIEGRSFGKEEAGQLFETALREVMPNIVTIFLTAARLGGEEGTTDVSLAV